MRYIECGVNNEFVSGAGQVIGAAGSHHDVALRITFGEMWDGLSMYVTFRDALGENPTVVQILPTNLVLGTERTYDVAVSAAAKARQGKAMVTVQGYSVVNGTQEASATNTATAYFTVLPSDYALADDESIDATLAQQLQAEIDEITETVTDARLAAKDAEAWAVGQIEGVDVEDTDTRYENNSKYYAQQADESATEAYGSASAAFASASSASGSATAAAGSAATATDSATAAATSATAAADSAANAATSAGNAAGSATAAATSATAAEGYKNTASQMAANAAGSASAAAGSATAAGTSETNAATSASAASGSATAAATSASTANQKALDAEDSAEDSEAWAVGQRGGQDVPSSDETYHNNAKYWAEQAEHAAAGGVTSFNGRAGIVVPQSGDYTAAQVGARPDTWMPTAAQVGADASGSAAAVQGNLDAHASNTTIHITAAERTAWNAKANFPDGGTEGQILTKTATGAEWDDAPLGFAPQVIVTAPTGSTVTLTNGTTTLTAVESGGTWTFDIPNYGVWTVTATLGADTASGTVSIIEVKQYTMTLAFVHIYGVSWDGSSTTAWTRTDEAAGFTDPVPYVAGASSYGSPFDNLLPWSGMTRVTDSEAGEMVRIPKFWYKITQSGNGLKIQIADKETDGFSVSPAHMDRGDGSGERDYVLIGRYHCASDYKSKTGVSPYNNQTRATFRSGISALGSKVWMADWAMRFTLFLLYLVEFADWNTQAKIGKGCGNNSGVQSMGYTDSMPYHTGTTQSSRDTFGLGTQYRYIEGLWDNVRDWIDGCYNSSNGLMIILNPASGSDSSGGVSVGTPSNGYPSKFTKKDVSGTFPLFIPTEASGSDSTYSCDYWSFNASNPCVSVGGDYHQYTNYGLFYFNSNGVSYKGASIGSRSMKLP